MDALTRRGYQAHRLMMRMKGGRDVDYDRTSSARHAADVTVPLRAGAAVTEPEQHFEPAAPRPESLGSPADHDWAGRYAHGQLHQDS
jgi:hypothetical protein